MKRFSLNKGDSKALFAVSAVKFILYAVWFVSYILCLILRASAFDGAQSTMAFSGQVNYTIEVTSPFFAVLRILIYFLPVLLLLWTVLLMVADKKRKALPDKKVIVAVFGADLLSAAMVMFDITASHMIF